MEENEAWRERWIAACEMNARASVAQANALTVIAQSVHDTSAMVRQAIGQFVAQAMESFEASLSSDERKMQ